MFSIRARLFHLGTENQIYPKMAKFVTFVWKVLETWFWCLSPGFGTWEIHWDHCQTPQIDLSCQNRHLWSFWLIKIRYRGLKMAKFVTFVWKVIETWFWCLSPGFGTCVGNKFVVLTVYYLRLTLFPLQLGSNWLPGLDLASHSVHLSQGPQLHPPS